MLEDGIDGSLSSRRVITTLAFILCAVAFIANLFFGMKIEAFIFDTMAYIAMAGLGATALDKFSSRSSISQTPHPNTLQPTQPVMYRNYGTPLPTQKDPLI